MPASRGRTLRGRQAPFVEVADVGLGLLQVRVTLWTSCSQKQEMYRAEDGVEGAAWSGTEQLGTELPTSHLKAPDLPA